MTKSEFTGPTVQTRSRQCNCWRRSPDQAESAGRKREGRIKIRILRRNPSPGGREVAECPGVIIHNYNNDSIYSPLAAVRKCPLWDALRFAQIAVLGATLFVVPMRAATIETMASLSNPLPGSEPSATPDPNFIPNPAYPQVRLANSALFGNSFGAFNCARSIHRPVFKF